MKTRTEMPWDHLREPGQVVSPAYLKHGVLRYSAEGRTITKRNGNYFNNRPLYCSAETDGVVLTGDRPLVRLLCQPYIHGVFLAAILRAGSGKWFHACDDVESRYDCGRMTWRIRDSTLDGTDVVLSVVPLPASAGFAVDLKAMGLKRGDRLVWAFGGARRHEKSGSFGFWLGNIREQWDPVYRGNPNVCKKDDPRKPELRIGFEPESCRGNVVTFSDGAFVLHPSTEAERVATGICSREGRLSAGDASAAGAPHLLVASAARELPVVYGATDLQEREDSVCWKIEVVPATAAYAEGSGRGPREAFDAAAIRLGGSQRVETETPEPRLDAAVAAVCHAIDGAWVSDQMLFRHGCMAWSIPFLGWRVLCGATALGWHDRIRATAARYLPTQVQQDEKRTRPHANERKLLCIQGPDSRFWGRGRLAPDPHHIYNTQSQFFDQLIRDWRWTADPELERMLRPALELHLEWVRECFDPDDDGLYESYINTLPTDCVWYNGGGSVEESTYAFYGHLAARDMARRAGDMAAAERHDARARNIQDALRKTLWLKDRGHFGLYVEQGGHRRVHPDAWVYSQFLPVDAGLTTPEEAAQALHYTEWGLERIRLPFGGVLCQPSNWVPSKWSVRDMFGGDMFHLALAHFQTGLAEEGWELMLGAMLESCYASAVPGGFSQIGAGTDFADNSHMFARAVVEGLFGFDPDYPNGVVRFRPAFPVSWPRASIRTPDFELQYTRGTEAETYAFALTRPTEAEFRLPVCAKAIRRVTLNGQDVSWSVEPGFGRTHVRFRSGSNAVFRVSIEIAGRLPHSTPVSIEGDSGADVRLPLPEGEVIRLLDPQDALTDVRKDGAGIRARLSGEPGHRLVMTEIKTGNLMCRQSFKVHTNEPARAKAPCKMPPYAVWEYLDMTPHFNGDVCEIFKQRYLSPRPDTCSVRLGADGYSAWAMPFWKDVPPEIALDNLPGLLDSRGRVLTPQGIPFFVPAHGRNIAFTSLWDNWPNAVTIPVHRACDVVGILMCGSTFPMQTGIANAEIRLRYTGGIVEKLELIPPRNFWSLCSWGGIDYSYETDAFCLPPEPPPQVQLGNNCRAMVLLHRLRPGVPVADLTIETLSQEVVIGLMAVSLASNASD